MIIKKLLSYLYNKQVTHAYALSCSVVVSCIIKKGFFNAMSLITRYTLSKFIVKLFSFALFKS